MTSGAPGFGPLRFTSDALPARDRIAAFREVFGRKLVRCDFEPLEQPFHVDLTLRQLPGLGLASVGHSRMRVCRTRALLADGDDALSLQVCQARGVASQLGREAVVEPGGAVLSSNAETYQFTGARGSRCLVLGLSREELRRLLRDFDAALMRAVPADTSALRLLARYVAILDEEPALTPEVARLAVSHVYDLAAMALGATRDAAEAAKKGGVRAARLQAIKADIRGHLGERTLSLQSLAVRHGISPVYIRKLFEIEATSFTQFVLAERLARAHSLLRDPRFADRPIGWIAIEAGFGDLSYFNRAFRHRFGAAPSDVRADARAD
jgi:AraC-like DNA-binding protein